VYSTENRDHAVFVLTQPGRATIMELRRVVVTGMGIVSSIGNDAAEVTKSLYDALPGTVAAPEYKELGFRSQVYGAPKLDALSTMDRRTSRFLSPGAAWNYVAMLQAIADAGLEQNEVRSPRTGLIMGSGGADTSTIVEAARITEANKSPKRIGPLAVPKAMGSTASATLATPFGIQGINYSITSACATSAHCAGNGYEQIQWDKQDIVFVGGHENLHWTESNLFDAMGAMSSQFNDTPERASRAYDSARDGFVIAGGAGVLVLEEYEHAKARGAKIYAEMVGYGYSSDGYDMVAPSGDGAVRSMRMALEGVRGAKIDYINTHGTSTPVGDAKEIEAIRKVFGNEYKSPSISSTKSLTGHALGAAGVHEAIFCILMMQQRFLAESANIENLDPEFEDMPILRKRVDDVSVGYALSNSFGFGGTNATLIFKHHELA
jgi:3-oxoacyl-[acyl-carrier-protein] synthase I